MLLSSRGCVFMLLCVREMVDIECFLRETAEKEAEAKSRLQVKNNETNNLHKSINTLVIC